MDEWERVRDALDDPHWDFRTVRGISRQTGLDGDRVKQLLDTHRSEVRQTLSRRREPIYTLSSRPAKMREIISDVQTFAGNFP